MQKQQKNEAEASNESVEDDLPPLETPSVMEQQEPEQPPSPEQDR